MLFAIFWTIQGAVLIHSIIVLFSNLMVDIAYSYFDSRIFHNQLIFLHLRVASSDLIHRTTVCTSSARETLYDQYLFVA